MNVNPYEPPSFTLGPTDHSRRLTGFLRFFAKAISLFAVGVGIYGVAFVVQNGFPSSLSDALQSCFFATVVGVAMTGPCILPRRWRKGLILTIGCSSLLSLCCLYASNGIAILFYPSRFSQRELRPEVLGLIASVYYGSIAALILTARAWSTSVEEREKDRDV